MSRRDEYKKYIGSEDWQEKRTQALDRTSGFCEFCGGVAVQVHHAKYPKRFGDDHPHNLIPICGKCHALAHGIRGGEMLKDAIVMSDLAFNGIRFKYVLSQGRVYASPASWIRALKMPLKMRAWFESGLATKAQLSGKELEMEYQGTLVYRWRVVAEQLRAFDRRWHQDQYRNEPKRIQEEYALFHENYEKLVSWGDDLQEKAINNLLNPVNSSEKLVTNDDLLATIEKNVTPTLQHHDKKLHEHDVVISEMKNVVPVLGDENEYITVKQAVSEKGLDPTTVPFYPHSNENLSGVIGQMLKKKNASQGEPEISRLDGNRQVVEVNTYQRGEIYRTISELMVEKGVKQGRLFDG